MANTKHTIEYIPLDEIAPYPNNPRINDDAVEYVANSIKEFGFQSPIILDKDNYIICGHTRYKAALKLGYSEVPCIVAKELSPEQVQAFRLADNEVATKSTWDFELLNFELQDLEKAFDMSKFGFTDKEGESDATPYDGGDDDEEEPQNKRCECPQCHYRFFISEGIIKEEDDF